MQRKILGSDCSWSTKTASPVEATRIQDTGSENRDNEDARLWGVLLDVKHSTLSGHILVYNTLN